MPTNNKDDSKTTTPYGAIIPGIIVALFFLPHPHDFGSWLLFLTVLIGPFLLPGKRRTRGE